MITSTSFFSHIFFFFALRTLDIFHDTPLFALYDPMTLHMILIWKVYEFLSWRWLI